jgi:hypothetical protein
VTDRTTFDPDALRKEFADYCTDVEPCIKAKAPRLNQLETLALIGMTLFQAAKELKAEKVDQAARIADLEASLQASRRAALEELLQHIPTTPEQMIDFIGSNFDSMQADGWTDTLPSKPTGDLSMVRYSLTVHDLLSAFEWSNLDASAIRALAGATE